jgi:hypothetical protein
LLQEPVAKLEVIVSVVGAPAANATVIATHDSSHHVSSARTNAQGRALLDVPPGTYRVSASLDGYQRHMTVVRANGSSVTVVRLQLTPSDPFADVPPGSGVVSGRVVDMNGSPVPYSSVGIYRQYAAGGIGYTGADGTFRFPVRANAPRDPYDKVTVSRSAPIWTDVPATVFLADQQDLPRSIHVGERQETAGLELRVSTSPHYRITAKLRDALGGILYNTKAQLFARDLGSAPAVTPDDTVVFGPVPRGPVTIFASADGRDGIPLAGVAELDVVDRPLDDVVIQLVPAARLRGRLEFSGREQPPHMEPPVLILSSIPGRQIGGYNPDDLNGRVLPDGSFALDRLLGPRCIRMTHLPAGWQLGAVVRDGRDITDQPIEFAPGEQVDNVVFQLVPGERETRRSTCGRP